LKLARSFEVNTTSNEGDALVEDMSGTSTPADPSAQSFSVKGGLTENLFTLYGQMTSRS